MSEKKGRAGKYLYIAICLLIATFMYAVGMRGNMTTVYAAAEADANGFVIENNVLTDYKGNSSIVYVPEGVQEISDKAFERKKNSVEQIYLPDSVKYVDNYAFKDCKGLTGVTFSYRVMEIGKAAFSGCTNLQSVDLSKTKIRLLDNEVFEDCTSLTDVVLPESVTIIGRQCFSKCNHLGRINLPEGISQIQDYAFSNCRSLSTLELPDSLEVIGEYAFSDCIGLTSVKIPAGVTVLGEGVFGKDNNLEKVYLPDTLKIIHSNAFDTSYNGSKGSLSSIYIPDSVEYIDKNTINRFSGLEEVQGSSNSVAQEYVEKKNIDSDFYAGVGTLDYEIAYSVVEKDAVITFDACGGALAELAKTKKGIQGQMYGVLPVPKLSGYRFAGWYSDPSLKKQVKTTTLIPKKAITLYARWEKETPKTEAYSGKSNDFIVKDGVLTEYTGRESVVIVPEGVTEIDYSVFMDKTFITKIVLPESVNTIRSSAFSGCNNLMELNIPKNVTVIPKEMCQNCALTSVVIPDGVTEIQDSAFAGNDGLQSVSLPKSLTTIGEYVFSNCSSLQDVKLPENLKSIGGYCFEYCSSLRSIRIPDGVTELPDDLFSRAYSLATVTLPEGLKKIGKYVFYLNRVIEKIYIPESATEISDEMLTDLSVSSITIVGSKKPGNTYSYYESLKNQKPINSDYKELKVSFELVNAPAEIAFDTKLTDVTLPVYRTYVGLPYGTLPTLKTDGKRFVGWSTDGTVEKLVSDRDVPEFPKDSKKITLIAVWENIPEAVGEPKVPNTDDGDTTDVIEIKTAEELSNIRENLSGHYKLAADIDLSKLTGEGGSLNVDGYGFCPIGVEKAEDGTYTEKAFTGVLDGAGHTIKGLHINGEAPYSDIGLFACVEGGKVYDLVLSDIDIQVGTGSKFVGSLAGYVHEHPLTGEPAEITKVNAKSGTVAMTSDEAIMTQNIAVGGIIGYVGNAKVTNCHNMNTESAYFSNGKELPKGSCSRFVGGVAGYLSDGGVISQCSNHGVTNAYRNFDGIFDDASDKDIIEQALKGTSDYVVAGGIVGVAAENGTVEECYNTGEVNAVMVNVHTLLTFNVTSHFDTMAGGIVGTLYKNTAVLNCYNTGTIKSWSSTRTSLTSGVTEDNMFSGILAMLDEITVSAPIGDSAVAYAAGIVGYSTDTASGPVKYCYNTGSLYGQVGESKCYVYGIANGEVPVAYCRYEAMTMTEKAEDESGKDVTYTLTGTPNEEKISTSQAVPVKDITKQESYRGFDFSKTWFLADGNKDNMTPILYSNLEGEVQSAEIIEDKEHPFKTQYAYGEKLDLTGLSLKVQLSGMQEEVTVPLSGSGNTCYNPYQAGEQKITLEYFGASKNFTVNVGETTYMLTIEKGVIAEEDGQGKLNGYYKEGEKVRIQADAAAEYSCFDRWVVVSGEAEIENPRKRETTVTTKSSDTVIVAEYVEAVKIEVVNGKIIEVNGEVLLEGAESGFYAVDDVLKVRANAPEEGKQLGNWKVYRSSSGLTEEVKDYAVAEATYIVGSARLQRLIATYIDVTTTERPTTEETNTGDPVPTERPTTEETDPAGEPITQQPATTERPTTEEPVPTEKPTTEKPTTGGKSPTETGATDVTTPKAPDTTTMSATKTANVSVASSKVKKVTKKLASKKVKISLKKISGVKYQVKVSTTKKFKKKNTVTKNVTKPTFTINSKKIKNKKKLYIKVRTYKIVNGKTYYGKWSKVKKVKIKK